MVEQANELEQLEAQRAALPSPGPPDLPLDPKGNGNPNAYQTLDPEQFRVQERKRRVRHLTVLSIVVLTAATAAFIWSKLRASRPLAADAYRYKSYDQIVESILALEESYPQFVEVFSAQERYGLPLTAELSCTRHGKSVPCEHYVVKITDKASLPDPGRPELFFSGALHGDERVGPQAALALAELLASNANKTNKTNVNAWLSRLVQTRTIVIMPTTNAYGYDQNTRQERDVDPNRDFPYLRTGTHCFKSMAARAANEVWRAHLFQLAVTWHGGTRSVTYEWGSMNHVVWGARDGLGSHVSPDDRGQFFAALGMSRFGGKFQEDGTYYETGRMNDIVYAVLGGMEDWGYAASWENEAVAGSTPVYQCKPTTFGGYDTEKSVYNNATHRAFNILVETSDDKEPDEVDLGVPAALSEQALADYLPSNQSIGHVPRNVRLALFYIDLVQPYVLWKETPTANRASVGDTVEFTWEVAGAITVDSTQLAYSTSAEFTNVTTTTTQSGVTRWYHPDMGETATTTTANKGMFRQSIRFSKEGAYYVQVTATVDQNWAAQPETPTPNVKPQTHIVNARTNDQWFYEANNKTVTGRTLWKSLAVKVVVR